MIDIFIINHNLKTAILSIYAQKKIKVIVLNYS